MPDARHPRHARGQRALEGGVEGGVRAVGDGERARGATACRSPGAPSAPARRWPRAARRQVSQPGSQLERIPLDFFLVDHVRRRGGHHARHGSASPPNNGEHTRWGGAGLPGGGCSSFKVQTLLSPKSGSAPVDRLRLELESEKSAGVYRDRNIRRPMHALSFKQSNRSKLKVIKYIIKHK